MAKYCNFKDNIFDYTGTSILYSKDTDYKVMDEDDSNYYFGTPISHGIAKFEKDKNGKDVLNSKFKVVEK